jgi:hypothetical protein
MEHNVLHDQLVGTQKNVEMLEQESPLNKKHYQK